jgi:hypothetical protein
MFPVDDYDARGHHESDAKFSDVDSASGGYPPLSFMTISGSRDMDSDDNSASPQQQQTQHASAVIANPGILEEPVADSLLPDTVAASEEAGSHQSHVESAETASLFSFMSADASNVQVVDACTSSEALVPQVAMEGAVEDVGSAFAFLSS